MNEYEQQANEFLKETGTEFKAEFLKHDFHFNDDEEKRDIYLITLKRGSREYKFNFGQSIADSLNPEYRNQINHLKRITEKAKPSAYDVLACLQTYEVGDFKNFCAEFGYNDDSIKAEKTYKAVLNEYNTLKMLYSDEELLKLGEIQ